MPAKPCTQLRSVEGIQYELVRKKVKQLHLRVRSNGTVMVSIPLTASLEQADRFVLQNAQWIRDTRVQNIAKLKKSNPQKHKAGLEKLQTFLFPKKG